MKTKTIFDSIKVLTLAAALNAWSPVTSFAVTHHRHHAHTTHHSSSTKSSTHPFTETPPSLKDSGSTPHLPFNLNWGDTREKLTVFLKGGGVAVKERRISKDGRREVWSMEGLLRPGPKVQSVKLIFLANALTGIEIQYCQPDWDTVKFNDVMGLLRKELEQEFKNSGTLITRRTEEVHLPPQVSSNDQTESEGDNDQLRTASNEVANTDLEETNIDDIVTQTLTGYEWKKENTIAQLFYFSAEKANNKNLTFRTISVHYRYQDSQEQPSLGSVNDNAEPKNS